MAQHLCCPAVLQMFIGKGGAGQLVFMRKESGPERCRCLLGTSCHRYCDVLRLSRQSLGADKQG